MKEDETDGHAARVQTRQGLCEGRLKEDFYKSRKNKSELRTITEVYIKKI
jgi:hypothetical protein